MKNLANAKGKPAARRAYTALLGSLVFLVACSSGLERQVPEATNLATQASSCLSRGGSLTKLSGSYRKPVVIRGKRDAKVDARDAKLLYRKGSFITNKNSGSFCLSGGVVDVGLSLSASWDAYHSSHALLFYNTPNATIENIAILNSGDAISFKDNNPNWRFRDSYVRNAGDDAIESDRYSSGTVEDVLVDAAFMGVSCRAENSGRPRSYEIRVKDSLIAMSPRRSAYLWKVTFNRDNKCKIVLEDNIFLLPKETRFVDIAQHPKVSTNPIVCRGKSTIVYTGGSKSYLSYLKRTRPDCFKITTDKSVWTKARDAWFREHSQFAKYR